VVPKHRRSDNPSLVSVGAPVSRAEFGYPASNGHSRAATDPGWAENSDGYSWQEWQDWHDWAPPPTLHPDHPSAPVPRVQFPADHPSGPYPIPRALPPPGASGAGGRPSPASYDQLRPLPPGPADGSASRGFAPQSAHGAARARGLGRHAGAATESGGYVAAAAAGAAAGQVHPDATRVQREPGLPRRDVAGLQREPGLPRRDAAGFQREPGLPRRDAAGFQREPGLPRRDAAGLQREPGLPRRDAAGFQREPGLPRRESADYQRQARPGWQETTDYRRETGPFGPGPGPATARTQNGRSPNGYAASGHSPNGDSLGTAGQARTLANGRAAQVAPGSQHNAAAAREAAEREAAAIRETAEREAAEMRARLESMLAELSRMGPQVAAGPVNPAMLAIATAPTDAMSARPGTRQVLPGTRPAIPARPRTSPAGPATRPGSPGTRHARPGAGPTGPRTRTAMPDTAPRTRPGGPTRRTATQTKAGQAVGSQPPTAGRQRRAARVAIAGTAALISIAAIGAVTMTAIHGFSFFVFRESAQGETPGDFTDANFLAGQKECPGAVVCPATHHTAAPTGKHHKTSTETTSAKK
jgi:hypothetical protein